MIHEAMACAILGVDAIGFVFFSKSPRCIPKDQAKKISESLPKEMARVGVFVNEPFSRIMDHVDACGLTAVQLHGQESPDLVVRLRKKNIVVIKALFSERSPSLEDISRYNASAFLVECGKGKLPGGNALEWDWRLAKEFSEQYPVLLAGGLSSNNVAHAIKACGPAAVDVSSGVESAPGRKDLLKVNAFVNAVCRCSSGKKLKKIFY